MRETCPLRAKSGHRPWAITNIREATKADAGVAELVIQYRHGEIPYWDSASGPWGAVMALRSDHHSDFEGAQLALLGMAGMAGIVLLFFVWTYFY